MLSYIVIMLMTLWSSFAAGVIDPFSVDERFVADGVRRAIMTR